MTAATTTTVSSTRRPCGKARAAVLAAVAVFALAACLPASEAVYVPTGSPVLSTGQDVAIYSAFFQSFCYWRSYDPQEIHAYSHIRCNVSKDTLEQASRFRLVTAYPRQSCGRVSASPYNVPVSFGILDTYPWGTPDFLKCSASYLIYDLFNIECTSLSDGPKSEFILENTVAPPLGVDGWLHGGATPVRISSVFTGLSCAIDYSTTKIFCHGPAGGLADIFYFIPLDSVTK